MGLKKDNKNKFDINKIKNKNEKDYNRNSAG